MTHLTSLTLAGGPVELVARLPDGRALAIYLDRQGQRTPFGRGAHCFELRGIGWHLAEIKALIASLPLHGAAPIAPTQAATALPAPEPVARRSRGFLHAHFTADRED